MMMHTGYRHPAAANAAARRSSRRGNSRGARLSGHMQALQVPYPPGVSTWQKFQSHRDCSEAAKPAPSDSSHSLSPETFLGRKAVKFTLNPSTGRDFCAIADEFCAWVLFPYRRVQKLNECCRALCLGLSRHNLRDGGATLFLNPCCTLVAHGLC